MKIGTVLSTCIVDIMNETVDKDDVLLILNIVGYDFNTDADWDRCWRTNTSGSSASSWRSFDENKVRELVLHLYNDQKIHTYNHSTFIDGPVFWTPWLELTIPDANIDEVPMLRQVWNNYLFLSRLASSG